MADTTTKKTLLNALHSLIQEILHVVALPFVWVLTFLVAELTYARDWLSKL